MGRGAIGSEDSLSQRRGGAEEVGLESSSSSHPVVMRFTGAHAPDWLSLPAALPLCARFLLHECGVSDWCSGVTERRSHSCVRGRRGSVAPAGAGCSCGDGTQRLRAGLSSVGPPGLGPRLRPGLHGSDSCRWCPSWSNNGGGLNHEAHKGHERRMGRIGRLGNCLSRPATTTLWLGGGKDLDPGLSSFLGQPWAKGRNAVGVDGGHDGARGLGLERYFGSDWNTRCACQYRYRHRNRKRRGAPGVVPIPNCPLWKCFRGGDVFIARGRGFGRGRRGRRLPDPGMERRCLHRREKGLWERATRTSPPRSWNGGVMSSSP